MPIEFGRIESVSLRDVWAHEANDFTPWLAKNLNYVSNAIGVPLELVETEASVDEFWADIVARNPLDNSVALIENQLEWSDHTHLGQILTYLAGVEARTVIWVARGFTGAHLSSVRWLNENTVDGFSFFAIRVSVQKVVWTEDGENRESPPVPQFEVLERPSDWDRRIRDATRESGRDLSAQGVFNRDFWTHYADRYPDDGLQRGFAGRNPSFPVHGTEFTIRWYHAGRNQIGQWVTTPNARSFQSSPESLAPYLPALAEALGIDPDEMWDSAYIWNHMDIANPGNWSQAADWLHEKLETYRRILSREAQE